MDFSSLQDTSFGPYPLRVCREKVGEFVSATGMDPERWTTAAPPAFLAAALFVVAPDLLARLRGYSVIHGEQTFGWHGPLLVESDLLISGTVTRIRERGGVFFVGFEMEVMGDDGSLATGASLFVVSPSDPGPAVSPAGGATEPLDLGGPKPRQKSASRSDLVRYAAATRDWNPIHWDHGSAVAAGLPGVVVHGLLQTAWALDVAAEGVDGASPFAFARIRFRNPLHTAHPVDLSMESEKGRRSVTISDADTQYLTAQVDLAGE